MHSLKRGSANMHSLSTAPLKVLSSPIQLNNFHLLLLGFFFPVPPQKSHYLRH
jgi:hypothetical protein